MITESQIIEMNELYAKYHNYSKVAKEVGCSLPTVKKYIIPDYITQAVKEAKTVHVYTLPPIPCYADMDLDTLLVLTPEEIEELSEFKLEV